MANAGRGLSPRSVGVSTCIVARVSRRLSLQLEDDAADELDRLAAADETQPEQYAASLLTHLVRGRALDAKSATDLLERMPGALDDAREGSAQARRGEVTPLDAI